MRLYSSLQAKVLKLESVVDEQNREILSLREKCEQNLLGGHQNELVSSELRQIDTADIGPLPSTMQNDDLVNVHQSEIAGNELAQSSTADAELLLPTMQKEDLTVDADAFPGQQSQSYASKLAATKGPKKNACVSKTIVNFPIQNFTQEETEPEEERFIGVQRKRSSMHSCVLLKWYQSKGN